MVLGKMLFMGCCRSDCIAFGAGNFRAPQPPYTLFSWCEPLSSGNLLWRLGLVPYTVTCASLSCVGFPVTVGPGWCSALCVLILEPPWVASLE